MIKLFKNLFFFLEEEMNLKTVKEPELKTEIEEISLPFPDGEGILPEYENLIQRVIEATEKGEIFWCFSKWKHNYTSGYRTIVGYFDEHTIKIFRNCGGDWSNGYSILYLTKDGWPQFVKIGCQEYKSTLLGKLLDAVNTWNNKHD